MKTIATETDAPPQHAPPASKRYPELDLARGLAVAQLLFVHGMRHFGVSASMTTQQYAAMRWVVSWGTPGFITLFGSLLEIVYLRRLRRAGEADAILRLARRTLQCYALFLLVVLAGLISGRLDMDRAINAVLFNAGAYFGNILKFYTFAIPLGAILLLVRARHGLLALYPIVLVFWIGGYAASSALSANMAPMPQILSLFFGATEKFSAPSVTHGLMFVAYGMALGASFYSDDRKTTRDGRILLGLLFVTVLATAVLYFDPAGGPFAWRPINSAYYYLYGFITVPLVLFSARLIAKFLSADMVRFLSTLGLASLFAFAWLSILLNLLPSYRGSGWLGLGMTVAVFAGFFLFTFLFVNSVRPKAGKTPASSLLKRLDDLANVPIDAILSRVRRSTAETKLAGQ